jgi:hypothetical protein
VSLHAFLRWLLGLWAVGLLCVVVTSCGGQRSTSRVANATTAVVKPLPPEKPLDADRDTDVGNHDEDGSDKPIPREVDKDNDGDSKAGTRYDSDDAKTLSFGHAATASDAKTIAALIRRYYAAAAAEDGTKACSMLDSVYAETLPEDYGTSPPGPAFAQGKTCAAVLTAVFKHFHGEVLKRFPKLEVSRIRIKRREGIAISSFGDLSEREIHFEREGHSWKLVTLIDNELP